jgi:hypothetical protein
MQPTTAEYESVDQVDFYSCLAGGRGRRREELIPEKWLRPESWFLPES